MQISDLNPDTITDLAAMRAVVVQLLNLIEAQAADITALRAANQQLRDELARLKGGSGKPDLNLFRQENEGGVNLKNRQNSGMLLVRNGFKASGNVPVGHTTHMRD